MQAYLDIVQATIKISFFKKLKARFLRKGLRKNNFTHEDHLE